MTIPTPPTVAAGTTGQLRPVWTQVATGKHPFLPWVHAILDGIAYFANGWDQAWYADVNGSAFWPLGSEAPESFQVADAAGGSTFAAGMELNYFLVFRNPDMGEETAPQATDDGTGLMVAGVTHTMVGTKDVDITWDAAEATARFTKVRIYRERQDSNDVVLVAEVAASAGTYTDQTDDSELSTALEDAYWPRYRLDLPPIFKGLATYQNRLFGFTGLDSNLYYGQQALPNGELVTTDFPAANIIPIEPDDGLGGITAVVAHYELLLVFKRRGCYSLSGADVSTFVTTRMFGDRGCLAPRCVLSVFENLYFLDERGLYEWSTAAEPVVFAGRGSGADKDSPLAPLWARLNLDAADMMHLVHNERLGYVEAWIALDSAPQARHRVRAYYRKDRYDSIDDGMVSCAAGVLYDGVETPYLCRLDDLGLLWQQDVGETEGPTDNGEVNDLDVISAAGQVLTVSGPLISTNALTGAFGAPVDRVNAAGVVVDENRVVRVVGAAGDTNVQLLRWSPTAVAATDTLNLGVIRDLWELPILDFATADWKVVDRMALQFDVKTTGTLRVDTAGDERAYTSRREIDLTSAAGWATVPCFERGYRFRSRFYSRKAGFGYAVRAVHIDFRRHRKRL